MSAILRIELRRSPLRLAFPVLLLLDLAVLFGRARWWIGDWPQASAAAQIPAFYLGPAAAIAAAWSAGRLAPRGVVLQLGSAARPRWQVEASLLIASVIWASLVYAAGCLVAAAVSMRQAGPGFLWPSYLLLGESLIIGCASLGHLAGRWSTSRVVAPLACGLALFVFLGSSSAGLDLFLLVGEPDVTLAWPAVFSRLAVALGFAVAAVVVRRPRRGDAVGSRARGATVVVCALVFALGLVGFSLAGPVQRARSAPTTSLCTTTRPVVCVWPEDRKYLPQLARLAGRMNALPAGLFRLPAGFYEAGLRLPGSGRIVGMYDSNSFHIREGAMWDIGISMSGAILIQTLGRYCTDSSSTLSDQLFVRESELSTWLTARITGGGRPADVHGGPPGVDVEAVGRISELPESAQVTWAQARLRAARGAHCA